MKLKYTTVNVVGGVNVAYLTVKDQNDALVAAGAMIALNRALHSDTKLYFDCGDFRSGVWDSWAVCLDAEAEIFRDFQYILEKNGLGEYSVAYA